MTVQHLAQLDEAAAASIASLLGAPLQRESYAAGGLPVFRVVVANPTLKSAVALILWTALSRVDVRFAGCSMVFKSISSIELYPGVEVLFRRTDPPGHLFLTVTGSAQMVV